MIRYLTIRLDLAFTFAFRKLCRKLGYVQPYRRSR